MAEVYAFLADGLEEVECLAAVDVLIRGGVDVTLVSISDRREVTGSHGFHITADAVLDGNEASGKLREAVQRPGESGGRGQEAGSHLCSAQRAGKPRAFKREDGYLLSRL